MRASCSRCARPFISAPAHSDDVARLAARVLEGDAKAMARAMSLVEDDAPSASALLSLIHPATGRADIIGLTGPPGAGKSTLADRLTARARRDGKKVGVVAVDPTSPWSGGAILGDRIRMQGHAADADVFIRSMASRGQLGGLAAATANVVSVLDAGGKDVVFVETVGVGQGEVEIASAADVAVVVLVPGLGDEIQTLKAGLLEIADVFVVNKADRDGAERLVAELSSMLGLAPTENPPPIVTTTATREEGIDALWSAIADVRDRAAASGARTRRRREQMRWRIEQAVVALLRARASSSTAGREALVDRALARELDPIHAALEIAGGRGIDHLGIAVRALSSAVPAYEALGFTVERVHDVPTEKVRAAFLPIGDAHLELLEPTEPGSVIARFLEKRSGIHHICVRVPDIERALADLKARGVPLIDEAPRVGAGGCRVAFLHPRAAEGVLIELKES